MSKFIAAVVQMNSQQDKRQNLADAKKFLEDAVAQGASMSGTKATTGPTTPAL